MVTDTCFHKKAFMYAWAYLMRVISTFNINTKAFGLKFVHINVQKIKFQYKIFFQYILLGAVLAGFFFSRFSLMYRGLYLRYSS